MATQAVVHAPDPSPLGCRGSLGFVTSDATVPIDQNGRSREARATFNEEANHVTVKLRFLQRPIQNQITYPNRSASTTHPSFQSDSIHTPFDGFSLPATDDAQPQCNFSFGPRRNVITVTLIASKDAA